MKKVTILKGVLGLALIYLIVLPIIAVGKAVEECIKYNPTRQKVRFNNVGKARKLWDDREFEDVLFDIDSKKVFATRKGLINLTKRKDIQSSYKN